MKPRAHLLFAPWVVTTIVCAVYIALFASLLYVQHVVPKAPLGSPPYKGVNVSEAWLDLQELTTYHHPYNSRKNDLVRDWLLLRIDAILADNGIKYSTDVGRNTVGDADSAPKSVVVYNDITSNASFTSSAGMSVYFEGTNVIVYIRGKEDHDWWTDPLRTYEEQPRGVLVNAHYDSVSTSYGATDDGVGVVSILQLVRYFTTPGHQPQRGIVALLNNGEEDYLNGANAFTQHPISKFPNTFLNLEGAGAGGRAACFRSTDTEVLRSYKKAPHPFGNVMSADGFKRGLIRSETDYAVFTTSLGMRGLDVAFVEPRSRYHTPEDSTKFTSPDSLWHMLSGAVETMKGLTGEDTSAYHGKGTDPVYFDMLGRGLGLMSLHDLFSLSMSLLVLTPLAVAAVIALIKRQDKLYLFARKRRTNPQDPRAPYDVMVVELRGWRGFTRWPIAFVLASAITVAFAFLVAKHNPYITYSSPYSVWSMLVASWVCIAWFILKGANTMRPTALHRAHALGWIFALFWILLIVAATGENKYTVGSGYPIVIAQAAIFVSTILAYLELFALPTTAEFVRLASRAGAQGREDPNLESARIATHLSPREVESRPGSASRPEDDSEATETTSLIRKVITRNKRKFGGLGGGRPSEGEHASSSQESSSAHGFKSTNHVPGMQQPYKEEQAWSGSLPSWLWIIEFLVVGPITIILFGQIGLFISAALPQTAADGNAVTTVYAGMAVVTIFLLIPASPYLHRFSNAIPFFLLLLFIGTLIYNLVAFPFSDQNRLKLFFQQKLDLDTAVNTVSLTGVNDYVQRAVANLPSSAGEDVQCFTPDLATRKELRACSWPGLPPHVVPYLPPKNNSHTYPLPADPQLDKWISLTASHKKSKNEARISVRGKNTRNCKLLFDTAIDDFYVEDAADSDILTKLPTAGTLKEIRLWSREWEHTWHVHVKWSSNSTTGSDDDGEPDELNSRKRKNGTTGLDGRVACMWSDINQAGTIPAFDEVQHFLPRWAIVTKLSDGLLEGSKAFMI